MGAEFSGEEILEITGGRLAGGMLGDDAAVLCTDTRELREGQWFVALPGRKYDGHDYIGEAFSHGALGCIVAERLNYPIASTSFPLIAVTDPFDALAKLARNWRRRIGPKLVLVTANPSESDRAAAAMTQRVLSASMRSVKLSAAVMSQEIVLKSLLSIPDDAEAVVMEICPTLAVEHTHLLTAAQPNIAILTRGGWDHLRLVNVEAQLIEAQLKFLRELDGRKCTMIIASTSEDLRSMVPKAFAGKLIVFGQNVDEQAMEEFRTRPDIDALVSAPDGWAAVIACRDLGLDYETIAKRLERN